MAKKNISKDLFEDYIGYVLDTDTPTSTRAYSKIEANFLQGRGNEGKNLWHAYNNKNIIFFNIEKTTTTVRFLW